VRRLLHDTPRTLKLLTSGLVLLALVLGLFSALGLQRDGSGVENLGARTAEVSATSDLYYRLNDMDAQAADALLVGYHPADPTIVPASVDAAASDRTYEQDRSDADVDLGLIARNPLLTAKASKLLDALGGYEALIAQALYIDQNAQQEQPATPPAAALSLYTDASSVLHGSLLPAAQAVTLTDAGAVNDSYSADHSAITTYGYLVLGLALLVALALYLGNRYYARRFRRRLGLLTVGMVIAVALGIVGLSTQSSEAGHLQVAKQSAYDSIYALDRAQAVSDDANADESRWLLEGRTATLQSSFFTKAENVGAVPGVNAAQAAADPSAYYTALDQAAAQLRVDAATNVVTGVTLTGFLGSELHNITFPGEGQAAYNAAQDFDVYMQDDAKIRQDVAAGDLRGAVSVDIGLQAGQSNYDFGRYMTALSSVIQINTAYFDSAVAAGHGDVGAASWTTVLLGELLLLLCIAQAGYLRLREYR
jgi:hypothetical protein